MPDWQTISRTPIAIASAISDARSGCPAARRAGSPSNDTGVRSNAAASPCRKTRVGRPSALAAAGSLDATPAEAHALATNVALVTTYWLNLRSLRRQVGAGQALIDDDSVSQGVFQVMSLITPYLRGEKQEEFRRVATRYLPDGGQGMLS